MATCRFVVTVGKYPPVDRPCEGNATCCVGSLTLCPQHYKRLLAEISRGVRTGQLDQLVGPTMRNLTDSEVANEHLRRQRVRRASASSSVVYFVERDGFIKIGHTTKLKARVHAISRGGQMPEGMTVGPVALLATIPGGRSNEGWLHDKFAEHRISGTEWFYPAPELRDFIAGLRDQPEARTA